MRAKTDSGPTSNNEEMPDYIQNIFQLMRLVSDANTVQKFTEDFNKGAIRYGDMKKQLAEDMIAFISPIRAKAERIYQDRPYLKKILEEGTEKARTSAKKTLQAGRELIGLEYFQP